MQFDFEYIINYYHYDKFILFFLLKILINIQTKFH